MSIRTRTATLTVGTGGIATEDVNAKPTFNEELRWAALRGVKVRYDETKRFTVDIRDTAQDPDDQDIFDDGEVLFHVYQPREGVVYQPTIESYGQGAAPTYNSGLTGEENASVPFTGKYLRVDVSGATSGSVIYVDVFVETAGDYRF